MRAVFALLALAVLSACGMRPLYSGGSQGVVAQTLGPVAVDPIPGRAGWLVRNALVDRLSQVAGSGGSPQYRLQVRLDDQIDEFGLRTDETVTRERRTLRARYQLVRIMDEAVLLDATAGADTGLDVVSSDYATVAAEDTALENLSDSVASQIVTRLSLHARAAAAE